MSNSVSTPFDPKRIYVFTDVDLDGASTLLALHWLLKAQPGDISFKTSTVGNIRKEVLVWLENDSILNYDQIYFLDLDTSTIVDLVDHKKVTIIDHHKTHVAFKENYKNANVHIIEATSCAKLLYVLAHKENPEFTISSAQKLVIALANDYDCYEFKLPGTFDFNCLFTNTQKTLEKTRTHKFVDRWFNGLDTFNKFETNIIKEYKDGMKRAIDSLQIYEGIVSIDKQQVRVMGTAGSRFVNDICDHLVNLGADVVFFVNPNNSHVSFRKKKGIPVDMSKLATRLCEGGGHEYAAGGKITSAFLEFTKQLSPYQGGNI